MPEDRDPDAPSIRCVAGLGNPGRRYASTRHSAGFHLVDRLARESAANWIERPGRLEAITRFGGRDLVLVKPLEYMNRSGGPVLACLQEHGLEPAELLVVVDDVSLPAGRLRLRAAGSWGGHRGLASIEEALGTDRYARLRMGVGGAEPEEDLAEYVLRPLAPEERREFDRMVERGAEAVRVALLEGFSSAMNRFNPPPPPEEAAGSDGGARQ